LFLVFFILSTSFTPKSHKLSPIPTCTTLIWSVCNNNKSNSLVNFLSPMYQILPGKKNLKYGRNNIINNKIH
jgi:hypothetical protein